MVSKIVALRAAISASATYNQSLLFVAATPEATLRLPVFDYYCRTCRRRSTKLFKTFAAVETPDCRHCGSGGMERLFSRPTILRGRSAVDGADGDDMPGMDAAIEGLESGDPRGLARMARQMSEEMGENLPDEYEPVLRRMEAGDMPDDDEFEAAEADLDGEGDHFDED